MRACACDYYNRYFEKCKGGGTTFDFMIKVFDQTFFKRFAGGLGGRAHEPRPQSRNPHASRAPQGVNCKKQSGGLFLQEGTPCKRGRPLFAARRRVAARKRARGKPRKGCPRFAERSEANKKAVFITYDNLQEIPAKPVVCEADPRLCRGGFAAQRKTKVQFCRILSRCASCTPLPREAWGSPPRHPAVHLTANGATPPLEGRGVFPKIYCKTVIRFGTFGAVLIEWQNLCPVPLQLQKCSNRQLLKNLAAAANFAAAAVFLHFYFSACHA